MPSLGTGVLILSELHKFFFQSYQFTHAKMLTFAPFWATFHLSTANSSLVHKKWDLDDMKVHSSDLTITASSQYH